MSNGIIYYNKGKKCLIRLCTSLYSLRKVYDGNVCVILEGNVEKGCEEKWVYEILKWLKVDWIDIENTNERPLVAKTLLYKFSPYDNTIFIDADTIVLNNRFDELFNLIEEWGFVAVNFSGWKTIGGIVSKRIKKWEKVCTKEEIEKAVSYGNVANWGGAVNTGTFGFRKDASIFLELYDLTKKGSLAGCSEIPDELACQILLPRHRHLMVCDDWNKSVKFGLIDGKIDIEKTNIIHYHGKKHCGDRETNYYWKIHYWEMVNSKDFPLCDGIYKPNGDRSFNDYYNRVCMRRKMLCFVTAVNERYLEKLARNFPQWIRTEGMMEYRFIVFVHGIQLTDSRLDFLRKNNVDLIEWDLKDAKSDRERMLNAFVVGVAAQVTTPFWVKIDADTKPKIKKLTITDEMFKNVLVGHKCSYTKVKEEGAKEHWLNTLDKWWERITGEMPVFPKIEKRIHRHRRLASFVQIHNSRFVRLAAKLCEEKMPVPSQDTYLWYVAMRLGLPMLRWNWKNEMEP